MSHGWSVPPHPVSFVVTLAMFPEVAPPSAVVTPSI